MPPPEAELPLARLPLNVLLVTVRVPWIQTPPPPTELVLSRTVVVSMLVVPGMGRAPPRLPPCAVLLANVLPVMVVVVFAVCTRTAPPSAVAVLPTKVLSATVSRDEPRLYTAPPGP